VVVSTESNKDLVRRYYDEVLNEGKIDALDELAVPDYQENDPLPGQSTGLQGLRDRVSILLSALSPHFTVHDVIAEGDRVVVRWTNAGKHVGEFFGMPATGREFDIAGIDIHRVQDGKLAEHWHVVDQLTMLQQLGAIPGPEGPET
jgi:steroid delta-isomerase-like uncharacterized protein